MTPLEDGSFVETATIGNEGMVGIAAFLGGGAIGNAQAMGQVPGEALRMNADHFRVEIDGDGKLRQVMFAYSLACSPRSPRAWPATGSTPSRSDAPVAAGHP